MVSNENMHGQMAAATCGLHVYVYLNIIYSPNNSAFTFTFTKLHNLHLIIIQSLNLCKSQLLVSYIMSPINFKFLRLSHFEHGTDKTDVMQSVGSLWYSNDARSLAVLGVIGL